MILGSLRGASLSVFRPHKACGSSTLMPVPRGVWAIWLSVAWFKILVVWWRGLSHGWVVLEALMKPSSYLVDWCTRNVQCVSLFIEGESAHTIRWTSSLEDPVLVRWIEGYYGCKCSFFLYMQRGAKFAADALVKDVSGARSWCLKFWLVMMRVWVLVLAFLALGASQWGIVACLAKCHLSFLVLFLLL